MSMVMPTEVYHEGIHIFVLGPRRLPEYAEMARYLEGIHGYCRNIWWDWLHDLWDLSCLSVRVVKITTQVVPRIYNFGMFQFRAEGLCSEYLIENLLPMD